MAYARFQLNLSPSPHTRRCAFSLTTPPLLQGMYFMDDPLWKTSLIKEKFFLGENVLDQEKEKSLLVENFLDCGKIFACGKLPSSWKNLCLRKTLLIMKKYLVVENFLGRENVFGYGKPF